MDVPETRALVESAARLRDAVDELAFGALVHTVYNPLRYAWAPHRRYLETCARPSCEVIFLGMNPGPYGMAQTGVPFGEIAAARDWLQVAAPVGQPPHPHPKRPVQGFDCPRSEVSGRRLWGLFASRFVQPEAFFARHFVLNYCPLVFMGPTGKNITPETLPASLMDPLFALCDAHLCEVVSILQPRWIVGVGAFAEGRARESLEAFPDLRFGRILHPSPASPAANRDWPGTATRQLVEQGIW